MRKKWGEIRAKASPEVLESAARLTAEMGQPRTLKDDVCKILREKLENHATCIPGLRDVWLLDIEVESLTEALAPLVCELIDHALQMDRVDRGLLPYEER